MSKPRNIAKVLTRDDKGAALLEMAVVIPIVLSIGLGVIEFANIYYNYHMIQNGVRDGARYAAGRPYSASDPACGSTVAQEAANIAATGLRSSGGTNRVSWWNPSDITVCYSTVANPVVSGLRSYRYSGNVPIVTVSTNVVYQELGFLGYFGIGPLTLHAQHEERVYGVR